MQNWEYKKSLASNISNKIVNEVYNEAMNLGCYGGKLCGAGGKGFMFFLSDTKSKRGRSGD